MTIDPHKRLSFYTAQCLVSQQGVLLAEVQRLDEEIRSLAGRCGFETPATSRLLQRLFDRWHDAAQRFGAIPRTASSRTGGV